MAGNKNSGVKSTFTAEIGATICAAIADGKLMTEACRGLGISVSTVQTWEKKYPEFHEAVRQARVDGAWMLYDEIFTISDGLVENTSEASRQRERLRIRMWARSKMLPAVFGEKLEIGVTHKVDFDAAMLAARARIARTRAPLQLENATDVTPIALPAVTPLSAKGASEDGRFASLVTNCWINAAKTKPGSAPVRPASPAA